MILGVHHPALAVPDLQRIALATEDYARDYEHLVKHGVAFNTPPMGESPARWAYGRDPFGNVIELLEQAPSGPMALRFDD